MTGLNPAPLVIISAIYFYQNWFFFLYAASILQRPVKKRWIVLAFFINYALFVVCSILQLHLVINWLLVFTLQFIEIRCFFRCRLSDSFILALFSMIIGLSLNILFRCVLAAAFDLPLVSFSNNIRESTNLKQYPVGLGVLAAGLYFQIARHFDAHMDHPRVIFQDPARKRFLIQLCLAIYLYLVLNLLIYSVPGNILVLKLWGVKSCVFSLIGVYLAIRYAARISRLSQYRVLNREVREALKRKKKEELELSRIASTDPLTRCPNRQRAETVITRWLEAGKSFCLCFVDLNGLKRVNDTQGHELGDLYLLTVVQTLWGACRQDADALFRYGGDEFVLLFPDLPPAIIGSRMDRVNRSLRARSHMPGHPFDMSISYGLAQSGEYESADMLIKAADKRMYIDKENTERNRHGIRP